MTSTVTETVKNPQGAIGEEDLKPRRQYKAVVVGVVLVALTILFATLVPNTTTEFTFSSPTDFVALPNTVIDAPFTLWICAAILAVGTAVAAALMVARRKPSALVWLVYIIAFVFGFLVWSGAGRPALIPMTTLIAGGLALSVPLVFGSLAGVVSERVGVVNIAIEAQLLAGAFASVVISSITGNVWVGLISAPISAMLVGVLLAWFAISYQVDQIIVGVVLNVLVVGLTNFAFSSILTNNPARLNSAFHLPAIPIPGLASIPVIGPVFFDQNILVYLMWIAVFGLQIYLFRSRWGLRLRSVGEHPMAADTVGINVNRTRWINTIAGSALAGIGGAYFTIGSGLAFGKEMTAGNGYIALAAMILGRWNPTGALVAALMFGFSRNIANTLSIIGAPVPSQFLLMMPYAITVLAVAGFVGKVRPPAAENIPYVKG